MSSTPSSKLWTKTRKNKREMAKKSKNRLLFVDTNKLLDFYRARNEAGLSLLRHLEKLHEHTITTFQVEMEFKKHRLEAIAESLRALRLEHDGLALPAFLQEAKTVQMIKKNLEDCSRRVNRLKKRVKAVVDNPPLNDEVYKTVQRLFADQTELNLHRDHDQVLPIKRRAWRRFITGAPPRKRTDTSFGDAINWEWILACVAITNRDIVVVSRDSDYGTKMDNFVYPNDWLASEVKRINKQRKLLVFDRLSDGLKELKVQVSAEEESEEDELTPKGTLESAYVPVSGVSGSAATGPSGPGPSVHWSTLVNPFGGVTDPLAEYSKRLEQNFSTD
jgi:hypothetical protein